MRSLRRLPSVRRLVSRRDERGVLMPTWALTASVAVVVVAMLAFVVTGGPDSSDEAAADEPATEQTDRPSTPPASTPPTQQPTKPTASPDKSDKSGQKGHRKPTARTRDAYVEVYNNSGVTGLASQTAATLQDAGWRVVGADNWYGDIPESTVYFPQRLRDQARLLARDVGVSRLHRAVAPMRFDRLTVILTGP